MAQSVNLQSDEFQPKNEYLLIKPAKSESEKKSNGGIIMLTTPKGLDRPSSGEVLSVGSDIDDISTGDFVLFPDTDGLDIDFSDGEFFLLRYESVIGMKIR